MMCYLFSIFSSAVISKVEFASYVWWREGAEIVLPVTREKTNDTMTKNGKIMI